MKNVQAVKCRKCGAPSYADQAMEGFFCPYCGDLTPWAQTRAHYTPDIVFRHRPIPVIDGLLKLTHVGLPEKTPEDLRLERETAERVRDLKEKLSELDAAAFKAWNAQEIIEISCKYCGAAMTGSSVQNIVECRFCGNKIMDAETFADGVYRKEIFGYDNNMYNKAVPFSVSRKEAKEKILQLAEEHPEDFMGQVTKERIDTDLQALFLPYRLEDVSLKATVQTERGRVTFYHDRINWAVPRCALFDIHLMNELHPWDFGETAPFAPAYMEGDVQIFAPVNNEAANLAMRRMLLRDAPGLIEGSFGLKNAKLLTWDYNFRRHRYAFFNLPLWFLDKRPEDGQQDLQIRAAVNAQTGKTSALFLQAGQKDYIRTSTKNPVPEMSDECTLFSPPIPIEYVKSPFLYRAATLEEALRSRDPKTPF